MKEKLIISFILMFVLSCRNSSTEQNHQESKVSKTNDTTISSDEDSLTNDQSDSFNGTKEYLDSLFNAKKDSVSFSEQSLTEDEDGNKINQVLLIGNLFSTPNKYALFLYRSNDSTLNCKVLKLQDTSWTKILETDISSSADDINDPVSIGDINGDKIPDLMIVKDHDDQAIHIAETADAWLFKDDSLTQIHGFDEIYNPEYDSTTNEVYSYISLGCADLSKYFAVFKILNNKAVKLKEVSCDCCYSDHNCEITINNRKPFIVNRKKAHKYAPGFYKEMYKDELEPANKKP